MSVLAPFVLEKPFNEIWSASLPRLLNPPYPQISITEPRTDGAVTHLFGYDPADRVFFDYMARVVSDGGHAVPLTLLGSHLKGRMTYADQAAFRRRVKDIFMIGLMNFGWVDSITGQRIPGQDFALNMIKFFPDPDEPWRGQGLPPASRDQIDGMSLQTGSVLFQGIGTHPPGALAPGGRVASAFAPPPPAVPVLPRTGAAYPGRAPAGDNVLWISLFTLAAASFLLCRQ